MTAAAGDDFARELKPTALVTGAAGGVGGAVARRFAEGGWDVVVTDVDAVGARRTADAVDAVAALPADLRDVAVCRALVADAVGATGQLDCLVNAAGVWTEGPTADTGEADFDRVMGVNLKGLFFVTVAAIPHLVASSGCVVNVSSDAGIQGNAGAAVYCASKGAVSILTKALALELAPQGVRVNAVCPGMGNPDMPTPFLEQFDVERYLQTAPRIPYHERGRPRNVDMHDVAEMVVWLLSDAARGCTGADFPVDAGWTAGTFAEGLPGF